MCLVIRRRPLQVGMDTYDQRSGRTRTNEAGKNIITRKMHQCIYCSYSTNNQYSLKVHYRTHTGEKPFSCPHCSYRCSKKFNLKIHLRIHTGEKPFSCPHCPYQSANSSHVNRHIRTHIGRNQQRNEADLVSPDAGPF